MKTKHLFPMIASVAIILSSCKPEVYTKFTVVDFEDVTLTTAGITQATFQSSGMTFVKNGTQSWDGGFTASNLTDTTTVGYTNDNSAAAGKGAFGSQKYGVGYVALFTNGLDTVNLPADEHGNYSPKSVMMTNNTYAYRGMKYGEYGGGPARRFTTGDWYKVTIKGFLGKAETTTLDYYLADFRGGKSFVAKEWQKLDLSPLGKVDRLVFTVSSSDTGEYGVNTPSYFCIDNLELTQEIKE